MKIVRILAVGVAIWILIAALMLILLVLGLMTGGGAGDVLSKSLAVIAISVVALLSIEVIERLILQK